MIFTLQELLHRGTTEIVVLLLLCLVVALLVSVCVVLLLRVGSLSQRLQALTRNADGSNLEEALTTHMRSIDDAVHRTDALEQAVVSLQGTVPACLQRVRVVRYDAFEDVGGEQSFAVALLDAQGDGVLLSSIYTRQDVRIYAKTVKGGQASHTLSEEESKALISR